MPSGSYSSAGLPEKSDSSILNSLTKNDLHRLVKNPPRAFPEQYEPHPLDLFKPLGGLRDRLQGDLRRLFQWKTEGAGGDRRERDVFQSVVVGESQSVSVAGGQELVRGPIRPVDRSQAMDHVFVGQVERVGDHRLTRPDRCKRPASLFESGSGGAMDRTGDATARHELRVRGVHHGIYVRLLGDVSGHELEGQGADALLHGLDQGSGGC